MMRNLTFYSYQAGLPSGKSFTDSCRILDFTRIGGNATFSSAHVAAHKCCIKCPLFLNIQQTLNPGSE